MRLKCLLPCLFLLFAACTAGRSKQAAEGPNPRLNDIWALERIGVEDIDPTALPDGIELPNIEFQLAENRVGGTDGCNDFSGQLSEVGERTLTFSALAMTRKACQGSRLPNRVNSALNKVAAYSIDGLKLSLLNIDGAEILRYKKVD